MADLLDTVTNAIADRISDRIGLNLSEVLLVRDRESRQILNRTERLLKALDAKINRNQGEIMILMSELVAQTKAGYAVLLELVATETAQFNAILAELQVPESALAELAATRQQLADGIAGIVIGVPSPVEPTPVPPIVDGELPPVVVPEEPVTPPVVLPDVELPVVIEPSPEDTGVDGGISVDPEAQPTPL